MRNLLLSVSIASIIVLTGCDNDEETSKLSSDKGEDSEIVVEANSETESESLTEWLDLSIEQKESKIKDELDAIGSLNDYTLDELIEKLDLLYQDSEYSADNFSSDFQSVITSMNSLEFVEIVEQYGDGSFSDFEKTLGSGQLVFNYFYEKDNKLYVLFSLGNSENNIYLSVAEDGKWIKKDIAIRNYLDDSLPHNVINTEKRMGLAEESYSSTNFYDNHIVSFFRLKGENTVIDYEFDETGIISEKVLSEKVIDSSLSFLNTSDKTIAFMLVKGKDRENRTVEIYDSIDFDNLIYNFTYKYDDWNKTVGDSSTRYLDLNNDFLYFGTNNTSRLDLKTGDLAWDQQGQQVEWDMDYEWSTFTHHNGELIITYNYGKNYVEHISVAKYTPDLEAISDPIIIPLQVEQSQQEYYQTETEDEIHIWREVEFKGERSLQLSIVSKGN